MAKRLTAGDTLAQKDDCGPSMPDVPDLGPQIVCHAHWVMDTTGKMMPSYTTVLVLHKDLGWWYLDNDADFASKGAAC